MNKRRLSIFYLLYTLKHIRHQDGWSFCLLDHRRFGSSASNSLRLLISESSLIDVCRFSGMLDYLTEMTKILQCSGHVIMCDNKSRMI